MEDINKLTLTIFITVEQVNQILALLGEQPLKNVVDLFNTLKAQGERGVQAAAERAQQDKQAAELKEREKANGADLFNQRANTTDVSEVR